MRFPLVRCFFYFWVSECFASWCGALRTDCASPEFGAEVRPRNGCEGKSEPSQTHPLVFFFLFLFFCRLCFVSFLAKTIVSPRRRKWFHAFSLAQPDMDVRFYPAPPANVGSCSLPTDPSCLSSLDYYHSNKVNNSPMCSHLSVSLSVALYVYLYRACSVFTHTHVFGRVFSTCAQLLQTYPKKVKCQQIKWPALGWAGFNLVRENKWWYFTLKPACFSF